MQAPRPTAKTWAMHGMAMAVTAQSGFCLGLEPNQQKNTSCSTLEGIESRPVIEVGWLMPASNPSRH